MSTTLSDGTTTLTFSADLLWADEFAWNPVEQSVERSITGALIIQTATRSAGRPITLAADADNVGWVSRSTLEGLQSFANATGLEMVLNYRGTSHNVLFRHQDGAIAATPVVPYNDVDSGDFYRVTLRFMKV